MAKKTVVKKKAAGGRRADSLPPQTSIRRSELLSQRQRLVRRSR
ncbi:hypothetical protein [Streptomyces albofaciens]|nr:hypothetical protein [Streptomyces albofaciens]